jgi:hypothetical protein
MASLDRHHRLVFPTDRSIGNLDVLPRDQYRAWNYWGHFRSRTIGPAQGEVEVTLSPDEQLGLWLGSHERTLLHCQDYRPTRSMPFMSQHFV